MTNQNTMKYVISALLGVGLFGFLYIIMEVITFYSFPRMLGSSGFRTCLDGPTARWAHR